MRSVVINIDSRCNASCGHCCFSCSPRSSLKLPDELVWKIVRDAMENPAVKEVSLSGGEIFLRKRFVFEIVSQVSASGKSVTCISNGFWGHSPKQAFEVLSELRSLGLRALTVSYDDFHRTSIPVEKIINIFDAAKHVPMRYALNMAVSRSNTGDDLLRELGSSIYGVPVTKFPIIDVGAAKMLPESEYIYSYSGRDNLRCPGLEIVYHHDGLIYPCCSPAVFESSLRVGRVVDHSLMRLQKRSVKIFCFIL